MGSEKGLLQWCDRCGTTCFRKHIGKGEADGGYTTWDKFENMPDGWEHHTDTGTLCPRCNGEYWNLIKHFKQVEVAERVQSN